MKRTGDTVSRLGEIEGSRSWTLSHAFTSKPGKEEEFGHFSIVQRDICKARQL